MTNDIRKKYEEVLKNGIHDVYEKRQAIDQLLDIHNREVERIIGEDEEPDIQTRKRQVNGKYAYEPAYSLRASVINKRLAEQRNQLKAKGEDDG